MPFPPLPPTPVDKDGKPVVPSFLDVFFGEPQVMRSSSGRMQYVAQRHRKGRRSSAPIPAVQTAAPPNPAPVAEDTAVVTPAPPTEAIVEPKPTIVTENATNATPATNVETASTKSDNIAWTTVEDAIVIGMKAQGRSWKEIGEAISGKDIGQIRQRFKELNFDVKGKGKEVVGNASGGEGSSNIKEGSTSKTDGKGDSIIKGGGSGNTQGRKKFEKKKHVKIQVPKKDSDDDVFIDPGDFPMTRGTPVVGPEEKRGILRVVEVDTSDDEEKELTSLRGRPIVYVRPEDNLTEVQLQILFELTKKNDILKWLEVSSRFFDKTGKRMEAEVLKAMLKNL